MWELVFKQAPFLLILDCNPIFILQFPANVQLPVAQKNSYTQKKTVTVPINPGQIRV